MKARQIIHCVVAIEEGSLASAAQRCGISPQGVSKSIRELENELGTKLLYRGNRGVAPTRFGTQFCNRADLFVDVFTDLANLETYRTKPIPIGDRGMPKR